MKNREGAPLNVTAIKDDLNALLEMARMSGHYYAVIRNQNMADLITYSPSFRKASMIVEMDMGEQIRFGRTIISGLQKTKPGVIFREIPLVKEDIITPEIISDISERLRILGLFSIVEVTPVIDESISGRANILVRVKEQDAGVIEAAPGFRSDIGLKLSAGVSYNNLGGKNRRAAFKGQVNQRLDWDAFDPRRVAEHKRMMEFMAQVSYHEPYFLGKPISMDHSFSSNRKRFRSFDATINQYELTLGKDLTRHLSASLRYQMEIIEQFDATYEEDYGYFRIGGLTPSLSLDFRDNIFNPMRGAFFNLSWEVANKLFFSMSKAGKEIDYHRLVSRNQFYVPLSQKSVLAMSVAVGMEKNLARRPWIGEDGQQVLNASGGPSTNGFIPGIKVFRLNGADTVRGFSDDEINRLGSGKDISSVIIQDTAYFTSIKIEPRYLIDDTTMLGIFVDAGRLYVDKWNDLSLRSSVGVTFKYLTPVGSINFDYGFKLWRRMMPDGTYEDPGRFHLSIGFF
jgi:outer membrane protein insertion porin family